jgi:voltage-gated potassium channel
MQNSLESVENRIKIAISLHNSILIARADGPLIDPSTCEVINECNLTTEMVLNYEQHIKNIKDYFKSQSSFLQGYQEPINYSKDIFEAIITTIACVEYVAATYLESSYKNLFSYFDLVIAGVFLADWIMFLVLSDKKLEFITSYSSLIDYLTIVPVYLEYFGSSLPIRVDYFRALRVLRALRILRLFKILDAIAEKDEENGRLKHTVDTSGISKQILITSVTLFSVLFIGAGIIYSINDLLENAYYYPSNTDFDFLAAFYYMIVTSSTLGYGDIYPIQTISRMATVTIIFFMIFTITNQLSKISQLMQNYSKYDTQYNFKDHVVIIGNYRSNTLRQFLAQFYHPDHGDVKTKIVIIGNQYPTNEIVEILNDTNFDNKIAYLEGNPSQESTWKKVNIDLAESVFVLTDQLNRDYKSQDTYALLLAKMIQIRCPLIKTYVQLIRPVELHRSPQDDTWNTLVSLQTIKMSLLGTSIHNLGFSTVMGGLYMTFGSMDPEEIDREWISKFSAGLAQEIYCVKISEFFIDMKFNQAVDIIYTHCKGILTIGVKSLIGISTKYDLLINPVNYTFQKDDLVFVITNDQSTADLITTYYDKFDYKTVNVSNFAQVALSQNFQAAKLLDREYTCELKSKSFIDLVKEDVNGKIKNHVLVFGSLDGFETLVKAIRVYSDQPICLVNINDPEPIWEKISRHENLFYFKGDMEVFQDLYNTGIKDCASVLILSDLNFNQSSSDSEVILLTKIIEYSFPHVRVTVELIDKSFIRFMASKPTGKYKKLSYNLWPNAASGKVYFSSNLNSFICQTYYNPDLLAVLLRIMGITKNNNPKKTIEENSIIRTVGIPGFYFEGRDEPLLYGEVFNDFLNLEPPVIPLGILSRSFTMTEDDPLTDLNSMKKVDQPVVFTNPGYDTHVGQLDYIICIGEPYDEFSVELKVSSKADSEAIKSEPAEATETHVPSPANPNHEQEAIDHLFNILKKRMEGSSELQKSIESKNKMIQDLQKEADSLKEQLIRQYADRE